MMMDAYGEKLCVGKSPKQSYVLRPIATLRSL
jgi:hypothetical protein